MEFGEFWQRFTSAEQRGEAFQFELLDVKLWPIFRTRVFYRLAQDLDIFQDPHPAQNSAASESADWKLPADLAASETVVVPFRRRVEATDPYSLDIISELRESGRQFSVLDFDDDSEPVDIGRLRAWGISQFEAGLAEEFRVWRQQQLNRWQGWRPRLGTPMHYEQRWKLLAASLEAEFAVPLGDFHDLPRWRLRRFFAHARAFERYFAARKVKRLFLVNSYSNPDIVLGAKLAGVRVIELQHGFISPMHPAYSFPRGIKSAVLPDELLVWGEHWKAEARLPRSTRIRITGPTSQFLATRAAMAEQAATPGSAHQGREIVFTSQGALAPQLLESALAFAAALPDYQVIYRLHPNEDLESYRARLPQVQPKNLELSHREPKFLDLLQQRPIVVGGFSTTLYEAAGLGLPAIALDLPGHEHLASAVAAGDMQLVRGINPAAEKIRELVNSARPAKNPQRYYGQARRSYF